MLRWARERGCPWYTQILQEAASSGHVEMTAWVMQELRKTREHLDYGEQAMASAAHRGHTAVCEYLRSQQCHWNNNATYLAAAGDHMDTLRWLHEQGCPWYEEGMCRLAAERDSTALLEYLQQEGLVFTAEQLTDMLDIAGNHSKLAPAQWLRQRGAEWPPVLTKCGRWHWAGELLQWARAEGCTSYAEP
jgi:hypothetical protein